MRTQKSEREGESSVVTHLGDLTLAWLDALGQLLELRADLAERHRRLQLTVPSLQVIQLGG